MAERTERLPTQLLRLFLAPAAFGGLVAAVTALIRRTQEPTLPRMSDEWLNSHYQKSGRHKDYE